MPTKVTSKNVLTLPKGRYSVGEGLTLLVSSETSRSWVLRYQMHGRRRDFSLGSANSISLTAAKAKALKCKAMIAEGVDPAASRASIRAEKNAVAFSEVADEAIAVFAEVRQWKNRKHAEQWSSTVRTYANPFIGQMDIGDITRDDILNVLKPIWKEKTETAYRLRGRLENIFDFAISKGLCDHNPARWKANLESFLPPVAKIRQERHFEALSLDKLKELAPRLFSDHVGQLATLFGILTASRAQEVLGMTWDEVDFESATWSLRQERTKTSVPHRVPLSRQAIAILKRIPRTSDLVFVSSRGKRQALAVDTPRIAIQRLTGTDATMHGMRSTFRDWGEERFIHEALLEKALSHSKKSKTVRAYQRSDLLEQRRPVMQAWADEILPDDLAQPFD